MAVMNVNWNPPVKMLRQFCVILVVFALLVAIWQYVESGSLAVSLRIVAGATAVSVVGYLFPPFARWVYVGMMIISFPIGWLISHVLLGSIFYLVITPVAIMMRLFGYDAMKRTIDKSANTYWQPRTPTTSMKRYFQQY